MSNTVPAITLEEAMARVATKTAPKITKEGIEAKIEGVSYLVHDEMTICIIRMQNGFMTTGKSAPASPANFDPDVGKRLAYDDAFRTLWAFEGYLLKEILWTQIEAGKNPVASEPASGT
jgi:Phage protein (N4 Gp49/phage Sf6 gene 66) family